MISRSTLIQFRYTAMTILSIFSILSPNTLFAETKEHKAEPPKSDSTHAEASHAEAKPIAEVEEENSNLPVSVDRHFLPFPKSKVTRLSDKTEVEIATAPGHITLVVFVSSWCVECQEMTPLIKALRKKYEKLGLDVTYAYSYDTLKDGIGSASEFGVLDRSVLTTAQTIQTFLSPELPSLYMSDRKGWLSFRKLKFKREDVESLDKKLALMFAF